MTSQPGRILLAEDDDRSRRVMERFLSSWGFSVVPACDGLEAAAILEGDEAPPLALVDWMMPGMEGTEICRLVRERSGKPYTYVILLTAKSDKEAVAEGLEAGADDFVTKPCDMTELRARLKVGERLLSLERRYAQQVIALRESLDQVRRLKELLPICAWCKRIRDDEDYWHNIDEYLHVHTGTDFTHGICPECVHTVRAGLTSRLPR